MQVSGVSAFALKGCSNIFGGLREWPWPATRGIYSPNNSIQPLPLGALSAGAPDLTPETSGVSPTATSTLEKMTVRNLLEATLLEPSLV